MADRTRAKSTERWIGWLVVIVAIVIVAQTAYEQVQSQHESDNRAKTVRCLSHWATAFQGALDARTTASTSTTANRKRYDVAVKGVVDAVSVYIRSDDISRLRSSLLDYDKAYADVQRASSHQISAVTQHPYPASPEHCIH